MAGSSTAEAPGDRQPVFFYDLASPDCYLAAERVVAVLGVVPEFTPIASPGAVVVDRPAVEARAVARGLQPVRWPGSVPFDSGLALRAATYAKGIGKVVAFSLAAFRQAFAGGRDLSREEDVLIAGAACELHPVALLKGAGLRSVHARLGAAGTAAAGHGVRAVPALWLPGGAVFHGDDGLEAAARALGAQARSATRANRPTSSPTTGP